MNYALNVKDEQIHIDDAKTGDFYKCPECKARAVARKGEVYRHHYSHYGATKCCYYEPRAEPAPKPVPVEHGPQNPTLDTPNVCPYAEAKERSERLLAEKKARYKKTSDERRAYVQMRVRQSGHGDTIRESKRILHPSETVRKFDPECEACRGSGEMYYGSDVEGECLMCDAT
jgi:hypothetical protein